MLDTVAVTRTAHGSGRPDLAAVAWASLVPLMLLMHPYSGIVQDARIYIGRGVADRDPAGVGRDVLFLHDGQTGFSLMRKLVDAALSVMGPGASAMALTFAGALLWLLAAVSVARALAGGAHRLGDGRRHGGAAGLLRRIRDLQLRRGHRHPPPLRTGRGARRSWRPC